MLLIADSGSTKCDWLALDGKQETLFETEGLNPLLMSADEMFKILEQSEMQNIRATVKRVFFYGTACSSDERRAKVINALTDFFASAKTTATHDMLAAAHATCGNDSGLVCILGTGSNAAYFDGANLQQGIPSLGYLLGDEGSGMQIGKSFLQDFFYGRMPEKQADQFAKRFELKREQVLQHLYEMPRPNAYLAGFAKFASDYSDDYKHNLVKRCLQSFVESQIITFPNYKSARVHFVGSIAHHFRVLLKELSEEYGFSLGIIIQKPIFNLGQYHTNKNTA